MGLLHCNHGDSVFLEEDDQGSRREKVGDLIINIPQDDACSKSSQGFATIVIRG
jgi:hypothetical protein